MKRVAHIGQPFFISVLDIFTIFPTHSRNFIYILEGKNGCVMSTLDQGLFQTVNTQLRDNSGRLKAAKIVFWILLGILAISFISYLLQHQLLLRANNGATITPQEATYNDLRVQILAIASLVIRVVAIVIFIMWFRRAYYNLHKAGLDYLSFSEGWAAGSWFVPFLNLVRPFQIMREIWEEMPMVIRKVKPDYPLNNSAVIAIWWLTFLLGSTAASIAQRIFNRADSVDMLLNANIAMIVSIGLSIVAILSLQFIFHKAADIERAFQMAQEELQSLAREEEVPASHAIGSDKQVN